MYRFVPTYGYSNGFLYNNWNYKDDMWIYEPRRIFDYLFEDYDKLLENFV